MQTLTIDDELTIFTAAEQKRNLLNFLSTGDDLEINLSQVAEMDTAGLQLLILSKREAGLAGKQLRFVMHSKAVLDILELANLTTAFGDQVVLAQN
ncbi:STAS domain-containing protein [Methylomonas sp. MED-D]|uniref:Anti-sigma B factor antagonist n=1 Tax=Methylomonas koyamae TaxID=702114 RepID=A0A177PHP6_9GAMM|nr:MULTISPECIES: STAS domain-containing protein [Methylomonas]NJA04608.1 STAS domain-containing protein [Methylococcaceae bacterium WWC4]MDT4332912.1 STAS domain-containing protein [Methylomonas sp. MV1]OAI28900.1 anti-sigma B factor antagonist [Methylomonas koyamae]OHX34154.1 anti-sigma B factor antagonist [Methylomonas sp. LWB]WGS86004.1 STAS domain-containing protein [Methylomonas sp. UP202]